MADPKPAIDNILNHEDEGLTGKITSDEGSTQWGIASRYNPDARYPMSLDEARAIYQAKYWTPYHLEQIADQRVANLVADTLVNPGPGVGAELVQQAINRCQPKAVAEDGKIGSETISRLNGIPPDDLIPRLRALRCMYYWNDVQKHPERREWLFGWLVRACS